MELKFYRPLSNPHLMRASLDLTFSEIFKNEAMQRQFLERILEDLARHITHEVEAIMFSGELDKLIKEGIREEVKKQVAATVEERLEEVFGED